jgi:quercetin dioxygenase-like cupin family protein
MGFNKSDWNKNFYCSYHPFNFLKKEKMKAVFTMIVCLTGLPGFSQQHVAVAKEQHDTHWQHRAVFQQLRGDSSLGNKEIKLDEMTIPAAGIDTVAHRHAANLIGYILEGSIITKMKDKAPQTLHTGEAFYEYPNELHEYIKNGSSKKPAKILLYYLFNSGSSLYTPATK